MLLAAAVGPAALPRSPAPVAAAGRASLASFADVLEILGFQAQPVSARTGQGSASVRGNTQGAKQVLGRGVRLDRLRLAKVQRIVDEPPALQVVPVHEGDGNPLAPGPAGPADPVQIGHVVFGTLVIHHVGHVVHIEPAGSHVGRDQDVHLAAAEGAHGPFPLALAEVTVHSRGGEAADRQRVGYPIAVPLGAAEDHGQPAAFGLQHSREDFGLVHLVGAEYVLLGGRHVGRLVVLLGPDVDRTAQVPPGERDDLARHGGREQHRLPVLRSQPQDLFDVGEEPQVEHLVGFVEHQRLRLGKIKMTLAGQVEQPAGGADHDVDIGQCLDLRLVGTAAVESDDFRAAARSGQPHVVGDLDGQFPGRHDDQGSGRRRLAVGRADQSLHHRNAEGKRLARASPGLPDQVIAVERDRQRQRLDGKGCDDTFRLQCRADGLGDSEIPERLLAGLRGLRHRDRHLGNDRFCARQVCARLRFSRLRVVLQGPCVCTQGFRLHQRPAGHGRNRAPAAPARAGI